MHDTIWSCYRRRCCVSDAVAHAQHTPTIHRAQKGHYCRYVGECSLYSFNWKITYSSSLFTTCPHQFDLFHLYYNYPYVCLSTFANCKSQFLLDRLGRCITLFVSTDSTSCHEFPSQFGLAIFLYAKNTQYLGGTGSPATVFILMKQRPVIDRQRNRPEGA